VKVAVTVVAAPISTSQVGISPAQAPDQPANVMPVTAVAVNLTLVPGANSAVQ
jgi:hypothetical protein